MNASHQSSCVIDGVNLTLGIDIHEHYNLNNLKRYSHRINSNGNYNKKQPILEPLEWIKSKSGQKYIRRIYVATDDIIRLARYHPLTIYTSSFYIYLGYLKHCIGSINQAIKTESETADYKIVQEIAKNKKNGQFVTGNEAIDRLKSIIEE